MPNLKRTRAPSQIDIPDVLGGSTENLESLFSLLPGVKLGAHVQLDLSQVSFILPYGLIGLMLFAQQASANSKNRVCIRGCQPRIFAYLERVNFFSTCSDCLFTTDSGLTDYKLSRSDASRNLLELEVVQSSEDVLKIASRMRRIFEERLALSIPEQNDLIVILSEMCDNICEHSQSTGHVVVQSYRRQTLGTMEVRIAICDLGIGIPDSLISRHGRFASTTADYIREALSGKSRRDIGIQGNGFQRVQEIISQSRGTLFVRSQDAAVRIVNTQSTPSIYTDLTFLPGTQLAIKLAKRTSVLLT